MCCGPADARAIGAGGRCTRKFDNWPDKSSTGPLGGVTASYMNFSIGFFVGGQVLAGILGSVVTFGYGREGKPGANCMQTAAASVAGMAGIRVLIQAMVWMGLPRPPVWQLRLNGS